MRDTRCTGSWSGRWRPPHLWSTVGQPYSLRSHTLIVSNRYGTIYGGLTVQLWSASWYTCQEAHCASWHWSIEHWGYHAKRHSLNSWNWILMVPNCWVTCCYALCHTKLVLGILFPTSHCPLKSKRGIQPGGWTGWEECYHKWPTSSPSHSL